DPLPSSTACACTHTRRPKRRTLPPPQQHVGALPSSSDASLSESAPAAWSHCSRGTALPRTLFPDTLLHTPCCERHSLYCITRALGRTTRGNATRTTRHASQ